MPRNPLEFAHDEARRNDAYLRKAFDKYLGNSNHPRGRVLSIYRNGRREMNSALNAGSGQVMLAVRDVLSQMRFNLQSVARDALMVSGQEGLESAQKQVMAYNAAGADFEPAGLLPDISPMVSGVLASFDEQQRAIMALVGSGQTDKARIIGDSGRLGILQPSPVVVAGTEFMSAALIAGLLAWWVGQEERPRQAKFRKQAIAVVDEKTTDCCLKVNGQIQDFNRPFTLTGTPRFADKKQFSPFHHRCRTSIALYDESFDFGITEEIVSASRAERQKRNPS